MKDRYRRRWLLAGLCLCLGPLVARTQPTPARVWRCGNSYSDRVCEGGSTLDPEPGPSTQARAQADAATRQVRTQADAMALERRRREATAASRRAVILPHPSSAQPERLVHEDRHTRAQRPVTVRPRSPKGDHFTARGPSEGKKKEKADAKGSNGGKKR